MKVRGELVVNIYTWKCRQGPVMNTGYMSGWKVGLHSMKVLTSQSDKSWLDLKMVNQDGFAEGRRHWLQKD